jgi:hypothetical protein
MATILKRKFTEKDSRLEILEAICTLASDKNERVLKDDHIEWLETKLQEIERLSKLLIAAEPAPQEPQPRKKIIIRWTCGVYPECSHLTEAEAIRHIQHPERKRDELDEVSMPIVFEQQAAPQEPQPEMCGHAEPEPAYPIKFAVEDLWCLAAKWRTYLASREAVKMVAMCADELDVFAWERATSEQRQNRCNNQRRVEPE